jgi:pimeloyl-ACP methyl ester carboxylesterase
VRRRHRDGLAYLEEAAVGAAQGTLLLVHGLGESSLCFEGLLREPCLHRFDRVAVDLPGYGASPWDREPRSLEPCAEELARWLLPLAPPVVVLGHSMGGVLGQLLLELDGPHRSRVRAFVNVEGNVSLADCTFSGPAAAQDRAMFLEAGFAQLLARLRDEGGRDPSLARYYVSCSLCDPRAYHRHSVELVATSRAEDLADRLAASDLPSIYVHGSPRGTGRRSLELLGRAGVTCREIAPAGHWPFLDQHAAFVDVLAGFLDDPRG